MKQPLYHAKRHLTLLEMLIAMAMTAVILMTLAMFYQNASHIGFELDKLKAQSFSLRHAENRLMRIFPAILKAGNPNFLFCSFNAEGLTAENSQNLLFTFNNGDSLDKIFSNEVIGRLFVDRNQALMLAYWPLPKRLKEPINSALDAVPIKKELLLENVEALHFEFYVAPEEEKEEKPNKGAEDAQSEQPVAELPARGEWSRAPWVQEYQQLPAMVRIKIKQAQVAEPLIFSLPLPSSKARIVYQ